MYLRTKIGSIMKKNCQPNGYEIGIQKGIEFINSHSQQFTTDQSDISELKKAIDEADYIVIGAGAGLSAAAGFTYSGKRFKAYFSDFEEKYGIHDMYSGGFYPYENENVYWAFWSRSIYINRYLDETEPVYSKLLKLVKNKDYFVITTNVDHQFIRAGFDKKRLFYTQGDYGLLQQKHLADLVTYDNEEMIYAMLEAQGFVKNEKGIYVMPEDDVKMSVPDELLPRDPHNGDELIPNLRGDRNFCEDDGWHEASSRYAAYLHKVRDEKVLYLEIGVGSNTPVIIKLPFWAFTDENEKAIYACVNDGQACAPKVIEERSIILNNDIKTVLEQIL